MALVCISRCLLCQNAASVCQELSRVISSDDICPCPKFACEQAFCLLIMMTKEWTRGTARHSARMLHSTLQSHFDLLHLSSLVLVKASACQAAVALLSSAVHRSHHLMNEQDTYSCTCISQPDLFSAVESSLVYCDMNHNIAFGCVYRCFVRPTDDAALIAPNDNGMGSAVAELLHGCLACGAVLVATAI